MTVAKKKTLGEMFAKSDKQMVDLLERIFQINPKKRIKI
jgi:hypothetical protein